MNRLQKAGMKNWDRMRVNYFNSNKKAQTLTELASFGSILLMVVAFLVSYGLRYNNQQDVQLHVFRMAMDDAFNNVTRPDASSSITMIEDRHIPDPKDRFGIGSFVPAQSMGQITWGNTLQDSYDEYPADFSRIKYVINGKAVREYTTEGNMAVNSNFYADILGERKLVTFGEVTCYWPSPDLPKLVRYTVEDYKLELISTIFLPSGGGKVVLQPLPIIGVLPAGAANGDGLSGVVVRSPAGGDINLYFAQLNQHTGQYDNNGDPLLVTEQNMQGLLYDTKTKNTRGDSLQLSETPGQWKSTASFNFNSDITRTIRKNSGADTDVSPMIVTGGKTLTTAK